MNRLKTGLAASTAAIILALAACTGGNVETKTEDEAKQVVRQRGEQVAALIGSGAFTQNTESPGPCEGRLGETSRDVFSVQGSYTLPLEPAKQLSTIARVREAWQANGYEITEDRTINQERGILRATSEDGFQLRIMSTPTPTSVGILIHSPCYRSPTPR